MKPVITKLLVGILFFGLMANGSEKGFASYTKGSPPQRKTQKARAPRKAYKPPPPPKPMDPALVAAHKARNEEDKIRLDQTVMERCPACVQARIKLKSGRTLEGTIVEKMKDSLRLEFVGGTITLHRSNIEFINDTPFDDFLDG